MALRQLVMRVRADGRELAVFVESDEEVREALASLGGEQVSLTPSNEADLALKTLLAMSGVSEWWKTVGRSES